MICSRKDDKELVRYNYKFIPESDKVEISNKDFYDVWNYEYHIKQLPLISE